MTTESTDTSTGASRPPAITGDQKHLIRVQGMHEGAAAIANIFLSLYLFDVGGIRAVALYYAADFFMQSIAFGASGYLLKRTSTRTLVRAGLLVVCCVYVLLLALGQTASDYVILIGLLAGIGDGLYWANINVNEYVATHAHSRNAYLGRLFAAHNFGAVIGPPVAGVVLTVVDWFAGRTTAYYAVFALLIALLLSIRQQAHRMPALTGARYRVGDTFGRHTEAWVLVLLQHFLRGIWVHPLLSFAAVVLFLILGDELTLSLVSAGTTVLVGTSSLLIGRLLQRHPSTYWLGGLVVPIGLVGFAVQRDWTAVLLYAVFVQCFDLFSHTSSFKVMYDVMDAHGRPWTDLVHLIVEREAVLNAGRLVGYLGVYWMLNSHPGPEAIRNGVLLIAGVPIVTSLLHLRLVQIGAYPRRQ